MSNPPGKLNTSMWERNASNNNAPGSQPQAKGVGGKASMFEQKAKAAAPKKVAVKKTWKVSGNSGGYANSGKFKAKTQIGDGPPPARSLSDLP
eukprot:TRINITY_DN609_c5_g1_i1.p1 TRINITY_DN609_c5_g1~~TRINITY_DN609_c5_g1_i1.p1  ORF type:complete len:103 (-),score=41.60 TRINITY_DN609_c5_g1_i1:203-481(-)